MWNLNYATNKPIYETESERAGWWSPRGRMSGTGWRGRLRLADESFLNRRDKQQGPTA